MLQHFINQGEGEMPHITIVFYGRDGQAAKVRAREIEAENGKLARVYLDHAWDGSDALVDAVEIMPCVVGWQRKRITDVFGDRVREGAAAKPAHVDGKEGAAQPRAKHRGFGKWYVMRGDTIVSGPHTKLEAQELATPVEAAA